LRPNPREREVGLTKPRSLLVCVLVVWSAACASGSQHYVVLDDIDGPLAAAQASNPRINAFHDADGKDGPDREDYRIGWVDLCKKSPCDAVPKKYSDLFREIAVSLAALRQVEFVVLAVASGDLSVDEARNVFAYARTEIPRMRDRLTELEAAVKTLDPAADFTSKPALAPRAASGAALAFSQLKDAVTRLPDIVARLQSAGETEVASSDGNDWVEIYNENGIANREQGTKTAPPGNLDGATPSGSPAGSPATTLHPVLRERVGELRERLEAYPQFAPNGRMTDEDVVRLATIRGLAALEQDLDILREYDRSHVLNLEVLDGEEKDAIRDWFAAQRTAVDKCVPADADGSLVIAGLHDAAGKVTGIQILESTFEAAVDTCVSNAVKRGRLTIEAARGGAFRIRLSTGKPDLVRLFHAAERYAVIVVQRPETRSDAAVTSDATSAAEPIAQVANTDAATAEPLNEPQVDLGASAPRNGLRIIPIVGFSTGGALYALSLGWAVSARTLRNRTVTSIEQAVISEREALDAQARVQETATRAFVTFAVGTAVVGGSIGWLMWGPAESPATVLLGPGGIAIAGSF